MPIRRRRIRAVRDRTLTRSGKPRLATVLKQPKQRKSFWTPKRLQSLAIRRAKRLALKPPKFPKPVTRSRTSSTRLSDAQVARLQRPKKIRRPKTLRAWGKMLGRKRSDRPWGYRGRRKGARLGRDFRYAANNEYKEMNPRRRRASKLRFWQVSATNPKKWHFRTRKNTVGYWEVTQDVPPDPGIPDYGTDVTVGDFPPSRITPYPNRSGDYYLSFQRLWQIDTGIVDVWVQEMPEQIGVTPNGFPMYAPQSAYDASGGQTGGAIAFQEFYYTNPPIGWSSGFTIKNQIGPIYFSVYLDSDPELGHRFITHYYTQYDSYYLGAGTGGYDPHPGTPSDDTPYLPAVPGQGACTPGGRYGGTGDPPVAGSYSYRFNYTYGPGGILAGYYPGTSFYNEDDADLGNGWTLRTSRYDPVGGGGGYGGYGGEPESYGTIVYSLFKTQAFSSGSPVPTDFPESQTPSNDRPYVLTLVSGGNTYQLNSGLPDPFWDPPSCLPNPDGKPTWTCTCPDFAKREAKYLNPRYPHNRFDHEWLNSAAGTPLDCKHIKAVKRDILPWAEMFRKLWKKGVKEYEKRKLQDARRILKQAAKRERDELRALQKPLRDRIRRMRQQYPEYGGLTDKQKDLIAGVDPAIAGKLPTRDSQGRRIQRQSRRQQPFYFDAAGNIQYGTVDQRGRPGPRKPLKPRYVPEPKPKLPKAAPSEAARKLRDQPRPGQFRYDVDTGKVYVGGKEVKPTKAQPLYQWDQYGTRKVRSQTARKPRAPKPKLPKLVPASPSSPPPQPSEKGKVNKDRPPILTAIETFIDTKILRQKKRITFDEE